MVMRTDSALTSAPQGSPMPKRPPPAPMPHFQAVGHAAAHAMRATPSHQTIVPSEQFFQSQQDFVSGVPYQAAPAPNRPAKKGR